jgi:ADP-ribosylglycohydrolase
MLPPYSLVRQQLRHAIDSKQAQGHVTEGLEDELRSTPDSYDALMAFARRLTELPLRDDWPFSEPSELEAIWAECDPGRPLGLVGVIDLTDSARRVEAAFLGSVCGCVLGKPLEIGPTMERIEAALESVGEWPLDDYVPEQLRQPLGKLHPSWVETVRGRIAWVAPDDDINYTVLGMLLLEQHGLGLTTAHVRDAWLKHLPIATTFGPERVVLLRAGTNTHGGGDPGAFDDWVSLANPGEELCGALIRADAYGYACPGRPALAAELAWRDARFTHRRTGIYGAMFVAAAISLAQVKSDPLDVFSTALQFVPSRSRFHKSVVDALTDVSEAGDWIDGYGRIHGRFWEYGHCRIYQEVGTLINTLHFAESVGDGICKQVSQGNDTDSFGATAGSLLGAYFGPGHLEDRWLEPFHDEIRTGLACFYERSLGRLARRMGELPRLVSAELASHPRA